MKGTFEDIFYRHYEKHIIEKIKYEIVDRYMGGVKNLEEIKNEIKEYLYDKVTIPYIDFSITTKCTLKCRDCTQWIPYINEQNMYSVKELYQWINNVFISVDYCIFLTILGGEPFLHPNFKEILQKFLILKENKRIGYLRIVTNGTILVSDDIIKMCADNDVFLVISDYSMIFNEDRIKRRNKFLDQLKIYGCKYFFAQNAEWIDLGVLGKKNNYTENKANQVFESCFICDCAAFFEGKLYHCPRCFVIQKNNIDNVNKDEIIDFTLNKTRNEIKEDIKKFYGLKSLSACKYCLEPQNRKRIEAARQLK